MIAPWVAVMPAQAVGTVKVLDPSAPKNGPEANNPKVCSFDIELVGFTPGESGPLTFVTQGGGPAAPVPGVFETLTVDAFGYARTSTPITLPVGMYKGDFRGTQTKVFQVRCDPYAPLTVAGECPANVGGNYTYRIGNANGDPVAVSISVAGAGTASPAALSVPAGAVTTTSSGVGANGNTFTVSGNGAPTINATLPSGYAPATPAQLSTTAVVPLVGCPAAAPVVRVAEMTLTPSCIDAAGLTTWTVTNPAANPAAANTATVAVPAGTTRSAASVTVAPGATGSFTTTGPGVPTLTTPLPADTAIADYEYVVGDDGDVVGTAPVACAIAPVDVSLAELTMSSTCIDANNLTTWTVTNPAGNTQSLTGAISVPAGTTASKASTGALAPGGSTTFTTSGTGVPTVVAPLPANTPANNFLWAAGSDGTRVGTAPTACVVGGGPVIIVPPAPAQATATSENSCQGGILLRLRNAAAGNADSAVYTVTGPNGSETVTVAPGVEVTRTFTVNEDETVTLTVSSPTLPNSPRTFSYAKNCEDPVVVPTPTVMPTVIERPVNIPVEEVPVVHPVVVTPTEPAASPTPKPDVENEVISRPRPNTPEQLPFTGTNGLLYAIMTGAAMLTVGAALVAGGRRREEEPVA